MKTKNLTTAALLTAVALIIFVIEAQIPPLTPVPGIKMGLSNVVTVFALFSLGPFYALVILLARILLGSMFAGQMTALMYSMAGGLLAYLVSAALRPLFKEHQVWVVSGIAAVFHNIGQIAAAVWITGTPEIVVYLPSLSISGIITGVFTGLCAQQLLLRLKNKGT